MDGLEPFPEVFGLVAEDVGGVGAGPEDYGVGKPGFPVVGGLVEGVEEGLGLVAGGDGVAEAWDEYGVVGAGWGGLADVLEYVGVVGPEGDDLDAGVVGFELGHGVVA